MSLATHQETWRIGVAAEPPLGTQRSSALDLSVVNRIQARIPDFWDVFVPLLSNSLGQS